MRLNREIKGYITRKVNEAAANIPRPALSKLKEAEKEREAVLEEIRKIAKKANDEADEIVKKHPCLTRDKYYKEPIEMTEYAIKVRQDIINRETDERNGIENKAGRKIDDIIVEMSLGGSKADLDRLLSEIKL